VLCVVGFEREGAFDELTAALTGEWCTYCRASSGEELLDSTTVL
jgi:hypothetical protein